MKSRIETRFFENEISLQQKYSFEKLGTQLHFLSYCSEDFKVTPPPYIQKIAKLMFNKLTNQTNMGESLKSTLLYTQSRAVIDDYISLVQE
jgi:hypothetical protein